MNPSLETFVFKLCMHCLQTYFAKQNGRESEFLAFSTDCLVSICSKFRPIEQFCGSLNTEQKYLHARGAKILGEVELLSKSLRQMMLIK
jgi:hypothetical protein